MKLQDMKKKSKADLQKELAKIEAQLSSARFKVANMEDKKVRTIRAMRKQRAQLLTLINAQD